MSALPMSNVALLVRTDFTNDRAWERLSSEVVEPSSEGFTANLQIVSDPSYSGMTWVEIKNATPRNNHGSTIVLIADATTLADPDLPVLVVHLMDFEGEQLEPFRCIPSELWGVENNLNLANMDWGDFANNTDDQRIFRGF